VLLRLPGADGGADTALLSLKTTTQYNNPTTVSVAKIVLVMNHIEAVGGSHECALSSKKEEELLPYQISKGGPGRALPLKDYNLAAAMSSSNIAGAPYRWCLLYQCVSPRKKCLQYRVAGRLTNLYNDK